MDKEQNESQNMKNTIAFVPFLAFLLYFIEKDKTERFSRNLKYAMVLFGVFFIASLVFRFMLLGFVIIAYLGFSGFLAFMAYNGKDFEIKFLDDIFKKFNDKK